MERAAEQLAAQAPREALAPQGEAARALERIYLALADFPRLVKKGIAVEEKLVEASKKVAEPAPPRPNAQANRPPTDYAELADRQRFVADLSRVLPRRAKAQLRQIEAMEHPRRDEPRLEEGAPPEPKEEVATPNLPPRQLAGLKESLQAALALSPEIERLTREAADDLTARNAAAALPKQEEALRLLKEIMETMPPQNQNQQQRNQKKQRPEDQQQSEQKQRQQDQKQKQESRNESRRRKDQEQESREREQEKRDQQRQDEQQAQQQQRQQDAQTQPKPAGEGEKRELTKEQTAALLQKVRERQRAHRARMRALERYLQRRQNVEHDW
jgi:hypothetical protein